MTSQLLYSLIAAISIGGVAGYLGSLMLQKRMSLAAGPLGHLAFPGVALAIIYDFDVSLGAFPFIILGIILIWLLENKTKVPTDTLTAIVFTFGVAISFLFLPIHEAEEALVGNISQVSFWDMIITLVLSSFVFWTIKSIFRKMTIINVSEDLAKVEGINIKKYNFIYLFSIALIVALGVKLVGALLTVALVSIPAATAKNISWSMKSYSGFSFLFGVLASIMGIILFKLTGLPAGILIILTSTAFFLTSMFRQRK
ncbi:MAG: metal ABC transporter permease [Bacteroidales bacterium]|nr:metal ABC transporter permease [Bacteroidales bacterium]